MVSTRPLISKSSSLLKNPLVTVSKTPITIGIIVIFRFHSFFQFPSKVKVLTLLFTFFQFYSVVSWDSKVSSFATSLFLLLIFISSGLLAEIRWSVSYVKVLFFCCCYYYYSFGVFHISLSWWFFTGVWVTASLLKSPGLFPVLCPCSIMLSVGLSPLVRQLPSLPGLLIIL